MNVMVFITDDGSPDGTGPMLFVRDVPEAVLPANPRSYPWRYFATVAQDDGLVDPQAAVALITADSYVSNRIVSRA